jgi:hypothetical protein
MNFLGDWKNNGFIRRPDKVEIKANKKIPDSIPQRWDQLRWHYKYLKKTINIFAISELTQ